jgi:hypothetical protein
MSPVETIRRAKAAGVQLFLKGDKLGRKSTVKPAAEILDDLAEHKVEILDLLRNPVCQQCGEGDGLQELTDGVWIHQECAAYRRRNRIPWTATLDELVRLAEIEVIVAEANACLEMTIPHDDPDDRLRRTVMKKAQRNQCADDHDDNDDTLHSSFPERARVYVA